MKSLKSFEFKGYCIDVFAVCAIVFVVMISWAISSSKHVAVPSERYLVSTPSGIEVAVDYNLNPSYTPKDVRDILYHVALAHALDTTTVDIQRDMEFVLKKLEILGAVRVTLRPS